MRTNNYFYLCSKELLNNIINFKNLENDKIICSQNDIDPSWQLISTALLLSENLLKNVNIYSMLNAKHFVMLENILDKNIMDSDYQELESFFLDENNNVINPFHNLMATEFEYDKYFEKEIITEYKKYGCNQSIITQNTIDYKKLIIRIRNSLAHSNYEILDEDYLRLYHYNDNKKMDFNVKINKVIVLTVIDELNEMAAKLYEPFLNEYYLRNDSLQYETHELTDEEIINYFMKYNILTLEEIKEVLEYAKKDPDFYPNFETDNNFDKFTIINDIIFDKIKPICDYGIILNELIYEMSKNDKSMDSYFYEKFGYYNYFNSFFFESSNLTKEETLKQNRFKIILLAYLNSIFLYNYNSHTINYYDIDFTKMQIGKNIKKDYIKSKYKSIQASFRLLLTKEKELIKISKSISKLERQLKSGNSKNDFLTQILPIRISSLKTQYNKEYQKYLEEKGITQQEMYNKLFEISDLEDNINLNANLSEYIINHIRNSLAHGYVRFVGEIDYNNLLDTIIIFEDYEKNNRKIKTFEGNIKLGDLLISLNNEKFLNTLFKSEKAK